MLIESKKRWVRRAQSTVEYGILIGVIVGAAVAMQTYVKRSLQARQKDSSDLLTSMTGTVDVGSVSGTLATTNQYEPYYLSRNQTDTLSVDTVNKAVTAGGAATATKANTSKSDSTMGYTVSR